MGVEHILTGVYPELVFLVSRHLQMGSCREGKAMSHLPCTLLPYLTDGDSRNRTAESREFLGTAEKGVPLSRKQRN